MYSVRIKSKVNQSWSYSNQDVILSKVEMTEKYGINYFIMDRVKAQKLYLLLIKQQQMRGFSNIAIVEMHYPNPISEAGVIECKEFK